MFSRLGLRGLRHNATRPAASTPSSSFSTRFRPSINPPKKRPATGANSNRDGAFLYLRWAANLVFPGLTLFMGWHAIADEYGFAYRATSGPSMLPTFCIKGDWVWISYFYRHGAGVRVGDVVSYKHPMDRRQNAMKRVVGMPGDFVLRDTPGVEGSAGYMVQVPEGHCWVVGDNLDWSRDSRMFGPLPMALIRGKALVKITSDWKLVWLGDNMELVKRGKGGKKTIE